MNTYKTKDGVDRILPGIGRTQGGKITTAIVIENPMFELVEEGEQTADLPATKPALTDTKPADALQTAPPAPTAEEIAAGVQNNKPQTEEQK